VRIVILGLFTAFVFFFNYKYEKIVLQEIKSATSTGQTTPTDSSTVPLTLGPTALPNRPPTSSRTTSQTVKPTVAPSAKPTVAPSAKPTVAPSAKPTVAPSAKPKSSSALAPQNATKPTFVLHVGLHKTGTSFLQEALCGKQQYDKAKGILNRDNFMYLGTGYKKPCLSHLGEYRSNGQRSFFGEKWSLETLIQSHGAHGNNSTGTSGSDKVVGSFKYTVAQARKRGRHAMVVFEELSGVNSRQIQALANLLTPYWNVQILVAYRPLYSWLVSYQNQLNKQSWFASIWPGSPQSEYHLPFDLDDERSISTIGLRTIEGNKKHPAELVRDKYKQSFDNVHVIPLHLLPEKWGQGDSQLGYIFCQVLKTLTPQTCQQVELGVLGRNVGLNPSVGLNHDVLADRAYEKKLIPFNSSRTKIIDRIRREQESKNLHASDFSYKCSSKEALDRFESLSLELERRLFPDNWTDASKVAHHAGFEKMLAKKSHCHIDADKTLEDAAWKEFFKKL
jgi:hypothetical protein